MSATPRIVDIEARVKAMYDYHEDLHRQALDRIGYPVLDEVQADHQSRSACGPRGEVESPCLVLGMPQAPHREIPPSAAQLDSNRARLRSLA